MRKSMTKRKKVLFKWTLIGVSLIGVLVIIIGLLKNLSSETDVVQVVESNYQVDSDILRMYPQRGDYLSESMGQYLLYLATTNNETQFKHMYAALKSEFVTGGYIKWMSDDTTVDAIVDTFRIVEALNLAADTFSESYYLEEAVKYINAIKTSHEKEGYYVDFYDWHNEKATSTIHLSYQNVQILRLINKDLSHYQRLFKESTQKPFFKEVYNLDSKSFEIKENVNLIDQFLIALSYVDLTKEVPVKFHQWAVDEYITEGYLRGQYDRDTKEAIVSYDSMAVNGLFLRYLMKTEENDIAGQVYMDLKEQLDKVEINGYQDVHVFDYLMAIQAVTMYEKPSL